MHVDPALILAEHVCGTGFTDLPAAAVTATKRDILDTLGAMLGGSVAPGLAQLTGLVKHWGGRQESSLLLIGGMVPAPQAALINATMGHALDFDDTFDRAGNIHPGTSTLAASLAVAEMQGGTSGRDFVLAVTVGLDVACRLALAATVDRGWHRTAAFGIFGATAAAGKLLRLNVAQMVDAFGIAYSQAAGTRQCIVDGALTKRLQAGQAASGAVLSAILAREGFTGAHQVFAGRFGFFPMYQPGGYDLDAITDGLGHAFRGVELSFKPYPSGRPNHAILDAALELYRRLDLSTADMGAGIDEVVITMNPQVYRDQFSPEPGKRRPSQVVEAQFSIPFLVAAALVRGRVGIGEVAGVDDPLVLTLSDRIQGTVREEVPATWAQITVRRVDGRSASVETTGPSGSPEKPLSDAQLHAKFRDCAAHAVKFIPRQTVEQAIQLIDGLDASPDATALVRLFS
ncbi:MAG TPA: MmgE/PrpD family protein [Candidatus Tectomicrobia bacterium]|nr:MmgE/PrpD family protein [Candidatus Tectomicrobia bacterium]